MLARRRYKGPILAVIVTAMLAALTSCGTTGSVRSGASDNGASGRVKVNLPF